MQSDLFGAPINKPVAPKKAPASAVPIPVNDKPAKDFSSHGAVRPYAVVKESRTKTIIWNLPVPQ